MSKKKNKIKKLECHYYLLSSRDVRLAQQQWPHWPKHGGAATARYGSRNFRSILVNNNMIGPSFKISTLEL